MEQLASHIQAGTLRVHDRDRSYLLYVPAQRAASTTPPPLVVVLHGSRQTGKDMRRATGYAFDRLADEHGFVAVYPDAYRRRWNDCRAGGRYAARRLQIDDVSFVSALIDKLASDGLIDPTRVFMAGYSGGGQLAFRFALERPERVAGIAAFSANLPTPEYLICKGKGKPVPALLVNGTRDRINPFAGGKVSVFGFASRGMVRSAQASGEYFAGLAGLATPERSRLAESPETWVEQWRWYEPDKTEVVLLAVHGGGHVVPGPSAAFPRILGAVSRCIDGPRTVWEFFSRQKSLAASRAGVAPDGPL